MKQVRGFNYSKVNPSPLNKVNLSVYSPQCMKLIGLHSDYYSQEDKKKDEEANDQTTKTAGESEETSTEQKAEKKEEGIIEDDEQQSLQNVEEKEIKEENPLIEESKTAPQTI